MQDYENVNEAITKVIQELSQDKVVEVLEFAKSLASQSGSQLSRGDLVLQQKALSRIWDNPEEDVYEL